MFDLITMTKKGIAAAELIRIVEVNHLKTNYKDGVPYYDNEKEKFKHGFYLRIDTGKVNTLKLECSLHKYYSYITTGRQTNFDQFSFSNAAAALAMLQAKTGIDLMSLNVTYYEVGLNLYMSKDCKEYIDQLLTIGSIDSRRPMFVNPRYKGERIKTTVFHRHIKKTYKAYDKVHEMLDKARNDAPPSIPNILRIETTQRRVEKTTVADLFAAKSIRKIADGFLKDWRTAQFEPVVEAPRGTHQRKIALCKDIILQGTEYVLNKARDDLRAGRLTERRFRDIREFVQFEWDEFKDQIRVLKAPLELEFRDKLNDALKIVRC